MSETSHIHFNELQKDVISNIISLNPTGKITFNGTFTPNGQISNVKNNQTISKEKLKKVNANEFVCTNNNIETFNNYGSYEHFYQDCNISHKKNSILFLLIILIGCVIMYSLIQLLS